MFICRSEPCPISVGCSAYVNLLFFPYLVSLSVVLIVSTKKPINAGFSGISVKWNISDASVGTVVKGHVLAVPSQVLSLHGAVAHHHIFRVPEGVAQVEKGVLHLDASTFLKSALSVGRAIEGAVPYQQIPAAV